MDVRLGTCGAIATCADVEAEWTKHLGKQRMHQLRQILTRLRQVTDPYL
jgi:hypothetical protein